jgi:cell division protein FtsW (lipid II flippase)
MFPQGSLIVPLMVYSEELPNPFESRNIRPQQMRLDVGFVCLSSMTRATTKQYKRGVVIYEMAILVVLINVYNHKKKMTQGWVVYGGMRHAEPQREMFSRSYS